VIDLVSASVLIGSSKCLVLRRPRDTPTACGLSCEYYAVPLLHDIASYCCRLRKLRQRLPLFVGLIESLSERCDDFLSGQNALQRRLSFVATGEAVTSRSGIYLIGTVDSWKNSYGGRIDVLSPGTYEACAFIDTNGNGVIDTNEPYAGGTVQLGTDDFELTQWAPAYN
jgi:hypothetical protein